MILYLARRDHGAGMHAYLHSFGKRHAHMVRLLAWEDVFRTWPDENARSANVCILTDLDRLGDDELPAAQLLHDDLSARGVRCLNNPARYRRRSPMLHALHLANINDFRALPASDPASILRARLPAFVREANEHWGPIGDLARSRSQLAARLARALARGHAPRDLLIVEFCDYRSSDGLFRKYAAFRLGDRIIARHVLGGSHWAVKFSRGLPEKLIAEELEYVRENPHSDALLRAFEIAGVDYGRADFAILNGRPVIFEINTNPLIARPRREHHPARIQALDIFLRRYRSALCSLDPTARTPDPPTPPAIHSFSGRSTADE